VSAVRPAPGTGAVDGHRALRLVAPPCGLPPFADIGARDYETAFEVALDLGEKTVESVASDPERATFDNTIVPLERAGDLLERVVMAFLTVSGADATDELLALEARITPRWNAFREAVLRDPRLFARIEAIGGDDTGLSPEQGYLVGRYRSLMAGAGVGLPAQTTARLAAISARLAALSAEFSKRLLADTAELAVIVDAEAELDGLSPGDIAAARHAAQVRGMPGRYLIALAHPTGHPYLKQLTRRALRQRIMSASLSRCRRGNANDTSGIVVQIVALRAEMARLLGHPSYASLAASEETAGTPGAISGLLQPLATVAARKARAEHAALSELAGTTVESWDWPYHAERMRLIRHDLDTAALRHYFAVESVLTRGLFHAARLVYGLSFTERADLRGWNDDCRVFEARDCDGSPLGLYVLDLYAREAKRGGARTHSLVRQARLLEARAVVCNGLHVPRPAPGEPALLTLEAVVTLFHEFGHALHALMSAVSYPSTSGLNVLRDFVEYPAQVNEMWALWPDVVGNYAIHVETGEPLPAEVIDRIRTAATFNQGFLTTEHLAAATLDHAWHTVAPGQQVADVDEFARLALARAGLDHPAIPSRYATQYFQHVFFGQYAARYYSYLWSEVLAADTIEWFTEHAGDLRGAGQRFRDTVLAIGGSADPMAAYRAFRGRDASVGALLRRRGLD